MEDRRQLIGLGKWARAFVVSGSNAGPAFENCRGCVVAYAILRDRKVQVYEAEKVWMELSVRFE
jgi:hypothetical protein